MTEIGVQCVSFLFSLWLTNKHLSKSVIKWYEVILLLVFWVVGAYSFLQVMK